ncbi:hypothetical protein D3C75_359470 [compost metagenome]
MRQTWVLKNSDKPENLIAHFESILRSIQAGATINEVWNEGDGIALEMKEEEELESQREIESYA